MSNSKSWSRYLELIKQRPECFSDFGPLHIVTDKNIVNEFQLRTGKTIGVCYESKFNILIVDLVYETEGNYFAYERILPAVPKGASVCIPKYQNNFILLKQYRHSMRDYQLSFPRGFATPGLSGEENASKELAEELGATVNETVFLGYTVADSGLSGHKVGVYLCDISSYQTCYGHEGITDTVVVSELDFKKMISDNLISDGFTLAAYSFYCCKK